MNILCLNKISPVGMKVLPSSYKVTEDINEADAILVRSAAMHEMVLPSRVVAVARAGAGVNNIPLEAYAKAGVVVFNTPGANANAVKELVICSLLLASRDIIGGYEWVKDNVCDVNISTTAEKAKSKFAGYEIAGKKIAVLGLGKIGILVANACNELGMNVIGYDPYLSVSNAFKLESSIKYVSSLEEAVSDVDYITIHIPANESTKNMLNKDLFSKMKKDSVLLNFSRDSIVNDDDLEKSINEGIIKKYVTDFANEKVVKLSNTIVLPHLGASTEEAEENCAYMAINQLEDYLLNGNIINSVNYPSVNAGKKIFSQRICICHKNIPGVIAKFSSYISERNSNIDNLTNKSKGDYAYTIIDVDTPVDASEMNKIDGILKVRVI